MPWSPAPMSRAIGLGMITTLRHILDCSSPAIRRFRGDVRGQFGVMAAVIAGVLSVAALGGVEASRVVSLRAEMQDAVDASALSIAQQGSLANATAPGLTTMAQTETTGRLREIAALKTAPVSVEPAIAADLRQVTILASATVPSSFGTLFSKAPTTIAVKATAVLRSGVPVCLIGLETQLPVSMFVERGSTVTAGGCGTFSNSTARSPLPGLVVDGTLQSTRICVNGIYGGTASNYAPRLPVTCPPVPDPFAGRFQQVPATSCPLFAAPVVISTSQTLQPGVYCGGIRVKAGATLTLAPGTFVIKNGPFWLEPQSALAGDGVTLQFSNDLPLTISLWIDANVAVSLSAPKTGLLAGMLMVEDPRNRAYGYYHVNSAKASNLLGTIYLPRGAFNVGAQGMVGDRSAYTVIVCWKLFVSNGANLFLNANYSATDVPVPKGVGPMAGSPVLTQ